MASCLNISFKKNKELIENISENPKIKKFFPNSEEAQQYIKTKLETFLSITGEDIGNISVSEFTKYAVYSLKYYQEKEKKDIRTTILKQQKALLATVDLQIANDYVKFLANRMKMRFEGMARHNKNVYLKKANEEKGTKSDLYREAAENETWNSVYHKKSLKSNVENYVVKSILSVSNDETVISEIHKKFFPKLSDEQFKKKADKYKNEFLLSLKKGYPNISDKELQEIFNEFNNQFTREYNMFSIAEDYFVREVDKELSAQDEYETYLDAMEVEDNNDDALEDTAPELNDEEANDDNGEGMVYTATRTKAVHKTISQGIRTLLSYIPVMNSNGRVVRDNFGIIEYMNVDSIINYLVSYFSDSLSQEEFWTKWNNLCAQHQWAKLIDTTMKNTSGKGNVIRNLFYHNFNKHSVTYTYFKKGNKITPQKRNNKDTLRDMIMNELITASFVDFYDHKSSFRNNEHYNHITDRLKQLISRVNDLIVLESSSQRDRQSPVFHDGQAVSFNLQGKTIQLKNAILKFAKTAKIASIITEDIYDESFKDGTRIDSVLDLLNAIQSVIDILHNSSSPLMLDDFNDKSSVKAWKPVDSLRKVLNFDVKNISLPSIYHNKKSYASYLSPSYLSTLCLNLSIKDFILNDFKQFANFYDKEIGQFWFSWLDDMAVGKKEVKLVTCLSSNNRDMEEQYPVWRLSQMVSAYFSYNDNKSKSALFALPMMGDSMHDLFIEIQRQGMVSLNKNESSPIIEGLAKVVLYEIHRRSTEFKSTENIKAWESKKKEFMFFPRLNNLKIDGKTLIESLGRKTKRESRLKIVKEYLSKMLEEEFDIFKDFCHEIGFDETFTANDGKRLKYLFSDLDSKKNAPAINYDNMLKEFFYESFYARTQMIGIFGIDPAFYGNGDDFFKRFLGAQSSMQRPNVPKGTKAKILVLDDINIDGHSLSDIKAIMDKAVKENRISQSEANEVIGKMKADSLNTTDGQTFMTFAAYRKYLNACGRWTVQMERSYNAIRNGTFVKEDLDVAFGIMKLFGFGTYNQALSNGEQMKVPFMMKTSCMPLIPLLMSGDSTGKVSVGDNSIREGLLEWCEKNDVDFICFDSALKLGTKNRKDIKPYKTKDEIVAYLDSELQAQGEEGTFMTVPYDSIGVIQETPQHYLDAQVVTGTQKIRHILDSLTEEEPGKCCQIGDKWLSKDEVIQLYEELLVADIADDFFKFAARISNKEDFFDMLSRLNENSDWGTSTMREYYAHADMPLAAIPNSTSAAANALSAAGKKIVRRMTKGSSYIQVASFGLTEDLKIRRENGRVTGIECYMPISSRSLLKKFVREDSNGRMEIDVNALPEDIRRAIGVRIPTEGYSSMKPLIIVGFTPSQYGGMIMLPAEATALDGSDFDVDKVFVTLPFFDVVYDNDALLKGFNEYAGTSYDADGFKQLRSNIRGKKITELETESDENKLAVFLKNNREKYITIKKVQYDMSKSALEQSATARANMFIDLSFALLTSQNGTLQLFRGGGFDMIKTASLVTRLLENVGDKLLSTNENDAVARNEIISTLNKNGIKISQKDSAREIYKKLCEAPIKKLTDLVNQFSKVVSLANPMRDIAYFSRVSLGAELIGIYAVNSAAQSAAQISKLGMKTSIVIDGYNYKSLSSLNVRDSLSGNSFSPISYVSAKQAASVDMAKDDSLGEFRQTNMTAAWGMLLSRVGVHPNVEVLLMNQPITKFIIQKAEDGVSINDAIKEFFGKDEYQKLREAFDGKEAKNSKYASLKIEDLVYGAYAKSELKGNDYNELQFFVASQLVSINKKGRTLTKLNNATRHDKVKNSIPSSISEYVYQLVKGIEARRSLAENKSFVGINQYANKDGSAINPSNTNYEEIQKARNPLQVAFLHYGVYNIGKLYRNQFPELSQKALNIIFGNGSSLYAITNSGYDDLFSAEIIKLCHDAMRSFSLITNNDFMTYDGLAGIRAFDNLITRFPNKLAGMKERFPENQFLKSLALTLSRDNNYYIIRADNVNHYDQAYKDILSNEWLELYKNENEDVRQFAIDLFKYSVLSNQGHGAFNALAPYEIVINTPGYIGAIEKQFTEQWSVGFMVQFLRNYYYYDTLVPIKGENNYEKTDTGIKVKVKYVALKTGFPIPVIKTIEKEQKIKQGQREVNVNVYKLWVAKSIAEGHNEKIQDSAEYVEYVETTPLGLHDRSGTFIASTSPEFDSEDALAKSIFSKNNDPIIKNYLKAEPKSENLSPIDVADKIMRDLDKAEEEWKRMQDVLAQESAPEEDSGFTVENPTIDIDKLNANGSNFAKFKPTLTADENNDLLC